MTRASELFGGGGPFNGVKPPNFVTGTRYTSPVAMNDSAGTLTTTATRLYYYQTYIWQARDFASIETENGGAGDNGDTYRVGVYTHGTSGPDQLVKDFGEVTLTGAAAKRLLTPGAAMTIGAPGWYWFAFHANQAAVMVRCFGVGQMISLVGYRGVNTSSAFLGQITGTSDSTDNQFCRYVDTAYGALASTAVAPTAQTNLAPAIWLVP